MAARAQAPAEPAASDQGTGRRGTLRVVAGILRDAEGRVLLAQCPQGSAHAGLWEFPGGKVEPEESDHEALKRELREELGVEAEPSTLFRRVLWRYPHGRVELLAYDVPRHAGVPRALHAQALAWHRPLDLLRVPVPAADRPIAVALALPRTYAITPEPGADHDAFLGALGRTLASGVGLVQLRAKALPRPELRALASAVLAAARAHGALALLNGDSDLAAELGFDGVHLRAAQLESVPARPLPPDRLVAASCHDRAQLGRALEVGVDFVTLSPVLPSASHPGRAALGWERFGELCARTPLPVFALGGMAPGLLGTAIEFGAHGAAGISGFWHDRPMHRTSTDGQDASA